jgi:hypothetical protein
MPDLDEFLRNELRRTVKPVDVNDVSLKIDLRRTRRARTRKIQSVALAVLVIAGSLGGVAILRSVFKEAGPGVGPASDVRNGVIVYSEVRNAGQHLWVVNPDGTGARQLTTDASASDTDPSISPDGRTVAFVRTGADGSSICLIEIDGTGLREFSPLDVSAIAPSWSPGGSRIAFATTDGRIFAGAVDGSEPRLLATMAANAVTGITWSPDGTRIAFSAPLGADASNDDLWVASAVSPDLALNITTTAEASESSPAWSPDGSQILFSQTTSFGSAVMLMAPETDAEPVDVTDGANLDQNPSWAPDGSRIVFDRASAAGTDVYTMRPDGSDLTLVTQNATDPAWQPLPADQSGSPSLGPPASPTNAQQAPGLGFPVCNVSSVAGTFQDGLEGTAYVATKVGDAGGCPPVDGAFNVIAIDLDGDGLADTVLGPIDCELECRVFSAPDLNGDGISELLVVQQGGTVPALGVFAMQANLGTGGVALVPIDIASPGDPEHGFVPDRPAQLHVGGDAGDSAGLSCSTSQGGVLLVQHLGSMVPFDSPDAVWKIHETTFTLGPDNILHVVSTEDREAPTDRIPFGGSDPFHIRPGFPCTR